MINGLSLREDGLAPMAACIIYQHTPVIHGRDTYHRNLLPLMLSSTKFRNFAMLGGKRSSLLFRRLSTVRFSSRHSSLGIVRRLFLERNSWMCGVKDW